MDMGDPRHNASYAPAQLESELEALKDRTPHPPNAAVGPSNEHVGSGVRKGPQVRRHLLRAERRRG